MFKILQQILQRGGGAQKSMQFTDVGSSYGQERSNIYNRIINPFQRPDSPYFNPSLYSNPMTDSRTAPMMGTEFDPPQELMYAGASYNPKRYGMRNIYTGGMYNNPYAPNMMRGII